MLSEYSENIGVFEPNIFSHVAQVQIQPSTICNENNFIALFCLFLRLSLGVRRSARCLFESSSSGSSSWSIYELRKVDKTRGEIPNILFFKNLSYKNHKPLYSHLGCLALSLRF